MAGFFKQLFSAKWQHKDPDVRLSAIDQSLDQDTLNTIATSDPSISVRHAAIGLIDSKSKLVELYNQYAAEQETAQLIFNNIVSTLPSDSDFNNLDSATLTLIAGQHFDLALAQSAIQSLTDEQQLLELIKNSPSAKARHLAIENIHNLGLLKVIEKDFKGKDKTLVRLAKDKIQSQEAIVAEQAKIQSEIEQIVKQANHLATQAFNPVFAGKLNLLKREWDALPEQKQAYADQFSDAITQCEAILKQNEQQQAELDEQASQLREAQQNIDNSIADANGIYNDAKAGRLPQINELQQVNQNTNEAIVLAKKHDLKEANTSLNNLYKSLLNLEQSMAQLNNSDASYDFNSDTNVAELKKQLQNIKDRLQKLNWPSDFPTPSLITSLQQSRQSIQDELELRKQKESVTIERIRKELKQMENALEEGQAKQAEQCQKQIKNLFSQVDVKQNRSLYSHFKAVQQTLFELNDWKGFASAPKLEALCEQMQQLADEPLDGKDQLERIQLLQEDWRAVTKASTQTQQKHYWPKFKQAKDIAFEVCNAFFAEQSQQKQANKQAREEICSQLEIFHQENDWQNSDFKAVVDVIAQAKKEYKQFAPVEQSDHKPLQNRFYDAIKAIEAKVDEHYQSIADEKQSLINQVSELRAEEDLSQAIEQCKAIQEKWKHVGNAGRKENSLWKAFRVECDALFDRRKQANEAQKQAVQAEISEANALLDGVTQEIEQGRGNLGGIKQIRQDIRNLNIPSKVRLGIDTKLDRLAESIKQQQQQEKQQALFSQWQALADVAKQLATEDSPSTDVLQALELEKTLQPVKQAATKALRSNVSLSPDQQQALCIELDITLGLDSPTEESELRMTAQVKRLQESIGQGATSRQQQILDLAGQWMSATPEVDTPYRSRFWTTLLQAVEPKAENATAELID